MQQGKRRYPAPQCRSQSNCRRSLRLRRFDVEHVSNVLVSRDIGHVEQDIGHVENVPHEKSPPHRTPTLCRAVLFSRLLSPQSEEVETRRRRERGGLALLRASAFLPHSLHFHRERMGQRQSLNANPFQFPQRHHPGVSEPPCTISLLQIALVLAGLQNATRVRSIALSFEEQS